MRRFWLLPLALWLVSCTDAPGSDEAHPTEADGTVLLPDGGDASPIPDEVSEPEVPAPTFALSDVVPARGSAEGGYDVTLVGIGFVDGMRVFFDGAETFPPYVASATVAGVTVPAGTPGVVDVRVLHPDGREWTFVEAFRYYEPFGITSIVPSDGPIEGGVAVEVEGFGLGEGSLILVGHRALISPERVGDTRVKGILPPGDAPGAVDVAVVSEAGRRVLAGGFVYDEGLALLSVQPYAGSMGGGQKATVHGRGLDDQTIVRFGQTQVTITSIAKDGRSIEVVVPPGAPGAVDVVASQGAETVVLDDGFFYVNPEMLDGDTQILAIWPPAGPTAGGKLVSIVAAGLTSVADARVHFGDVEANVAALDVTRGVLTAVLPAHAAGVVDVVLTTANGVDVAESGFTYFEAPALTSVTPDQGPAEGGTVVVLEGSGFSGAAKVRVGALVAPTWSVKSDTRIELVTPPGSPGWAHVVVETPSGAAVLENGFVYEAGKTVVFAVDPESGALPGGQSVRLIGTDFPQQARVFFNEVELASPIVEGPTSIRVTTPPWLFPASVDVKVRHPVLESGDVLEDGFTYFNPAASTGGTWGPTVDGTLNVSVLDMWSSQGIENAFVILWTDTNTPYQGFTDGFGNITFNGPDLAGVQMVSAWAPNYSASSIVEFDAENATVLLFPASPPSSGGGGGGGAGFEPATIRGHALINDKYLIPPPGTCGGSFTDPVFGDIEIPKDYICKPCAVDGDCGPAEFANECTTMFGGGAYCTTACESGADCPSGYACLAVELGASNRCMPVSGTLRVTCRVTASTPFSSPPGGVVEADLVTGEYEIVTGGGKYAVVCQGESWDPLTDEVIILALGAQYPVVAEEGQVLEDVDVAVDVPFKRSVTMALDYPPTRLLSLPQHQLRALLAFGDYGFHEVVRASIDPEVGAVQFARMPEGLTGSLTGARWHVMGGAYSEASSHVQWFPPYSTAILRDLPGLGESHLYGVEGDGTLDVLEIAVKPLMDIIGFGEGQAVAVGNQGGLYQLDGSSWKFMGSPLGADWRSVWGAAADDLWVVGSEGRIARWNGAVWTLIDTFPFEPWAVGGTAADDVVVVGEGGQAMHFDGNSWAPLALGTTETLRGVWGDPASHDLWIVGDASTLLRRHDGAFAPVALPGGANLFAVAGSSDGTVVVGGEFGTLRRRVGNAWPKVETGDTRAIYGLWVGANGAITAVGERGLMLAISATGVLMDHSLPSAGVTLRAAWGAGAQPDFVVGQDAVLVGPLLELPAFLPPLSEGSLPGDVISWAAYGGPVPDFSYVVIGQPWWRPLWQVLAAGGVTTVELPDLKKLVGKDQILGAGIPIQITRGKMSGFDIDNFEYINLYFPEQLWDAWSVNETTFTTY